MSYFTLCVKINISIVIKSILIYTQRECRRLSKKNNIIEQSALQIYCALQYLLLFCEMTDCDLCGSRIPIVIQFLVFRPLLKFAYPERCMERAMRSVLISPRKPIWISRKTKSRVGRTNALYVEEETTFS